MCALSSGPNVDFTGPGNKLGIAEEAADQLFKVRLYLPMPIFGKSFQRGNQHP